MLPDAVTAAALPAPNLSQNGILDDKTSGFPIDIFKDSKIEDLTAQLEAARGLFEAGTSISPQARELLARLVLTRAYDPQMTAPEQMERFLASRIMLGFLAGQKENAAKFLEKNTTVFHAGDWQNLITFYLQQAELDSACAVLEAHPPEDVVFTQKAGVLCALRKNKSDVARLQLDVMREAKDADPLFLELAERAITKKAKVQAKAEKYTVLHHAAFMLAQFEPTEGQLAEFEKTPSLLLTELRAPELWTVDIAQRLAANGVLSRAGFEAVFDRVKLTEEKTAPIRDNPDVLATGEDKRFPLPFRFFYGLQALAGDTVQTVRAHILSVLMEPMRNVELLGPMGEALHTYMDSIAPLPENEPFAPQIARLVLLRSGKEMQGWWKLSITSPITREKGLINLPLALARGLIKEEEKEEWLLQYLAMPSITTPNKVLNLLLLKALGTPLPASLDAVFQQSGVDTGFLTAALPVQGQRGELLLALLQKESDPQSVLTLVRILAAMNLRNLAEAFAFSAMQY